MRFAKIPSLATLALLATSMLAAPATFAANSATPPTDYLVGYVGYFDIVRNNYESAQFGLEYRASPLSYGIRPTVGINVTTDNAVYGYAGFHWDVPLIRNQLYLIPNFAAGAYKQGDGKNLGGTIEFRSGIELDYQFQNAQRVGIAFNHISNASIYDHNPGSETLLVNYSLPTGAIFR